MADIFSKDKRSQIMKCVKGKDTSPEKIVRSALHRAGFRFRLHRADLPGKPDIVLSRYRTVIFVNGCFWHQHPGCRKATIPEDNSEFWQKKLSATMKRDEKNQRELRDLDWHVVVVWECEILKSFEETMNRIFALLKDLQKEGKGNEIE